MSDLESIVAKLDGFIESQRQINDAIMAALGNITPEVKHLCTIVETLLREKEEVTARQKAFDKADAEIAAIGLTGAALGDELKHREAAGKAAAKVERRRKKA